MRKLYLLLFFIACCHTAWAGKTYAIGGITFKHARLAPDPAPTADFKTLVVPIKRAGNLIIVEATVDTLEGNFILDTGAPYLVLNETYFRDAPKIEDEEAGGVNGQAGSAFKTYVHNFRILDLQYSRLTADVTDLSAIENGRGIKILGLLGTRLFSKFALTVDLLHNELYIHKLDEKDEIPETERIYHNPFMTCSFEYENDVILMKGAINDHPFWFAFDTGAELSLLEYRVTKKIGENLDVISRSKLTGIGGSVFEEIYAKFDNLRIGNQVFMQNRVLVTDLDKIGKVYGTSIDGVLGYDFFVRGIFTINFAKKKFEMYIYTNR